MYLINKMHSRLKVWSLKKKKKDFNLFLLERLKEISYLKNYHPICKQLIERYHDIYYHRMNKNWNIEHQLGILLLPRTKDYFLATVSSIINGHPHSAISILRSSTENLFLLKFLQKKPEQILKFMRKKNPKFFHIVEIKKEISNETLNQFYNQLCLYNHANRAPIKMTYYPKEILFANNFKVPTDTIALISDIPLDYKSQQVSFLVSALNLYKECLDILEWIMIKDWVFFHK